ncbi:hypothetical protein CfE428DRAFT_4718 [Chthoniobacter flavus Ellin428]|uniref:Uncharacterized protein n=2 Tax=Chthoniobacter flavus TaxID=191863 RepID=B4D728_9BACT|nr:hypothetical protein CfE428DRAFT_4718 [Chthoniobacter flavus Ellin428]TCO84094.1 hypothetical protein EV701_13824 [Chthoniobacter flavus]
MEQVFADCASDITRENRYGWVSLMDPNSPNQPSGCRKHGCLIAILTLVVLIVVAGAAAYYTIFHTAMPFRLVANMMQKANPSMRIEGIDGNLSTGVSVASIKWGDAPGSPSEITGLRIRYNGYEDAGKTHRLVINDVGVNRAHIDIADLPSNNGVTTSQSTTVVNSNGTTTTTTTTSSGSSANAPNPFTAMANANNGSGFPQGLDSVEVRNVSILDVLITNRNVPEFRVSIPKIEWTGFKATPDSFEPGVLTIESDRLAVATNPGRTVTVEGQSTAFQKSIIGMVQPALHPAIKQSISFSADVSFVPKGGALRPYHFVAADGKLEINEALDGSGAVHARQLDLAGLIDPRKLFGDQTADLPSDLVLNAVVAKGFEEGNGTMKIVDGSFRLGTTTFEVQPLEFSKAALAQINLKAVAKTDAGNITWSLPLAKFGSEYHPSLAAQGMSPGDVLAHLFAGKAYAELSADEKKTIDARIPVYFSPTEK